MTHGRLTISKWGQEQLDLAELRGNVRQLNIMMSEKRFNVIMDIMQARPGHRGIKRLHLCESHSRLNAKELNIESFLGELGLVARGK